MLTRQIVSRFERYPPAFATLLIAVCLLGVGCTRAMVRMDGGEPKLTPLTAQEKRGDLSVGEALPPYRRAGSGVPGRVFLVAAGAEVANFAQEVVDQRRHWIARGVPREQIYCYYAKPTAEAYREDRDQFEALRSELEDFYAATPRLIARHLAESAEARPDSIYLYITGHGMAPLSYEMSPRERSNPAVEFLLGAVPAFDDFHIHNGAIDDGTANLFMKAHAVAEGADPHAVFLTPGSLRAMLDDFPDATRRIVVLQACHAGGFLRRGPDLTNLHETTLQSVPRLTAIAASRYDRESFGCGTGNRHTVFGGELLRQLFARPGPPWEIDWTVLHGDLSAAILEREIKANIAPYRRSLPVYLETLAAVED